MQVTAEISLYPLESGNAVAEIVEFIGAVRDDARLRVVVNQMSTQITGELGDVMDVLNAGMRKSFGAGGKQVLVAKFLNTALPITETPVLASS